MLEVPAVMESAAQAPRHVMARRQNGRETVHFDPGDGFPVCGQIGSVLVTTDPDAESDDFTLCGKCMRQPRWRLAWKAATKKVAAP